MDDTNSSSIVEPVTKTDILQLFSWDRERTTDELMGFIARRESALSNNDGLELGDV